MSEGPVFAWSALPAVTEELSGTGGTLRNAPEDFRVREIPSYLPQGSGSHLYLYVRKRELTTRDLVATLRGAGVPDARIGVAGLKDKYAVTEQWISIPWAYAAAADVLAEQPGVEVLERSRHKNKLGVGHLRGNRFTVRILDAAGDATERARAVMDRLGRVGAPNYFGPQRFGRFGRNAVDGLRVLHGERVPGDRRLQRFFLSAVQSHVFNHLLADRIREGLYRTVLPGDWAQRLDSGGVFRVEDACESARAERLEITALLPLHGRKVRISSGEPGRRERDALAALNLTWRDLVGRRGDRRPSRVVPAEVEIDPDAGGLWVAFTLPKGAYATTVLREVTKTEVDAPSVSPSAEPDASQHELDEE